MSDLRKSKLESLGFGVNHFALIGIFGLVIAGSTLMKDPVMLQNITTLKFLKAAEEEAPRVIEAPNIPPVSYSGIDEIVNEKKEMMSLIDPTYGEGSVLGLSTDAQQSVENLLSNENLSTIPVKEIDDSQESIQNYIDQVNLVEAYHGQMIILSAISSFDPVMAQKGIPLINSLIGELKGISVPSTFVHYHRVKLMQNAILLSMANSIIMPEASKDKSAAGILFFEVTDELEAEKSRLINQYSFPL